MKFKKILLIVIASFTLLVLVGLSYQFISTKIDDCRYPAPGKMVAVDGFKLHINCSGTGTPTVILESGLANFSTYWTFVQKGVEQFAHVCSYDRAGRGWSEKSPNPRTGAFIVKELHTLLQNMHAQPPYILVGHSSGGINMRLYANTYPDEVFGIVLVDSSHEKQEERFEEVQKRFPRPILDRIKGYILTSRIAIYLGITRLYLTLQDAPPFPTSIKDVLIAKMKSTNSLTTDEFTPFKETLKQIEQSHNALEDKPLIVITGGKELDAPEGFKQEANEVGKIFHIFQKELLQLSKVSKQVIAENSGHMINLEQPEIIVDAIREMVNDYRKAQATPLAAP
ncbi:MAG: alpha/beta hydrolase [Candidatus Dependentiae bacterium]|nr:alpha/beta hydrolase [Candidatus Dependentiae bacterium]